jgi:hypothetical protein
MTPFYDGENWVLEQDLLYEVGDSGQTIRVPRGFVTDLTSTPRAIWFVIPPFGRYQFAAIVHDYLYWDQACTKAQADTILWHAMVESGVGKLKADAIWEGVHQAGQSAWNTNKDERDNQHLVRQIPEARFSDIHQAGVVWVDYRQKLKQLGYRPAPTPVPPPSYCLTGNR